MIRFAGRSYEIGADRVAAFGVVTREDLVGLERMPNLRALNLNTAAITDDDREPVGRLGTLEDMQTGPADTRSTGPGELPMISGR